MPARPPTSAAGEAGEDVGGGLEDRQGEQDRGGDRDADRVEVVVDRAARLGAADREPGGDGAERHPVAAGDHLDVPLGVGDPAAASIPSEPQATSSRPVARLPRRRSSGSAKIARATATTNR